MRTSLNHSFPRALNQHPLLLTGPHFGEQVTWDDVVLLDAVRDSVDQYRLFEENQRLQASLTEKNSALVRLSKTMEQKVAERTAQLSVLHSNLESAFNGAIDILAELGANHCPSIHEHGQRVTSICLAMATYLGFSNEEKHQFNVACKLHDIGLWGFPQIAKLGHANGISNKLTVYEQQEYRHHPAWGAALIRRMPHLETAAAIVEAHHAYWDGSGIPVGMKGLAIPKASRILAVVDALDDWLTQQCLEHHQTITPELIEQGIRVLQHWQGKRYDPAMVSLLEQILRETPELALVSRTLMIPPARLHSGMTLAKDLVTPQGVLVLKRESTLTSSQVHHIITLHQQHQLDNEVAVYPRTQSA